MVWIEMHLMTKWVCPGGSDSKELICNVGDLGSIPGMGRSSGEGNGNPLQYFCLENPMDRGAWWATVHGVTVLDMMEWLSVSMCVHGQTHTHTHTHRNKISPALKKEQNAIVECSLLCEWPFSLSFFFFSSWFFSPQFAPTPPPCLPKASLDFCLFLQPSCQLWKLPDNFFSSLLFYFH